MYFFVPCLLRDSENEELLSGMHSSPAKSCVDWVNTTNDISYALSRNVYTPGTKDANNHSLPTIFKFCFYASHLLLKIDFRNNGCYIVTLLCYCCVTFMKLRHSRVTYT